MKKIIIPVALTLSLLTAGVTFVSCDEESLNEFLNALLADDGTTLKTDGGSWLGWLFFDEHTETIEDDIDLNDIDNNLSSDMPSKVDLSANLPRIGDQGQYGTCVAWATAYNCRTWLYAKSKGLTTSQLNSSNTFSAADVFMAIDNKYKGSGCGGTNFRYAFDVMQKRGVATEAAVPYSQLDCSCSPSASATSNASGYKIKAYREIDITNVETIKRYLSNGRLVVFGAKLGDEFMYANDNSVLTNQTSFKSTGQHGYHALVCSGYDDNKGANGAFRVVNSWGTSWGDDGYIWVDYKFFCGGKFAYTGFVAYGDDEQIVVGSSNTVVNTSSGYDLVPATLADLDYDDPDDADSNDPTWRTSIYNVYNAGESTLKCDKPWAICYVLYDAYNANNYQVLLVDLYTDEYGTFTDENGKKLNYNFNWDPVTAKQVLGVSAQGYCWSNVSVKGGESVSHAVYGDNEPFEWSYKMPNVSGSYYLVLISDAFSGVDESNEDNNYYYLTTADGGPLKIEKGVIKSNIDNNKTLASRFRRVRKNEPSPMQSAINEESANTYTTEEISALLNGERRSGRLAKKMMEWQNSADAQKVLAKAKKNYSSKSIK